MRENEREMRCEGKRGVSKGKELRKITLFLMMDVYLVLLGVRLAIPESKAFLD